MSDNWISFLLGFVLVAWFFALKAVYGRGETNAD